MKIGKHENVSNFRKYLFIDCYYVFEILFNIIFEIWLKMFEISYEFQKCIHVNSNYSYTELKQWL